MNLKKRLAATTKAKKKTQDKLRGIKKETADAISIQKKIDNMNPVAAALFKNEIENGSKPAHGRKYSEEIKIIALQQSFYSNGGYENLRLGSPGEPGLSLPNQRTLRRSMENIQCNPGHHENVYKEIQLMTGGRADEEGKKTTRKTRKCNLKADGMHLKPHLGWDPQTVSGQRYFGTCTIRDEETEENDLDNLANEALTFMLEAVDGSWKYPVGYWLTKGAETAENQAILINQALILGHEHDLEIVALVMDRLGTNLATLRILGCNLDIGNLQHWFPHPATGKRVYGILDAVHMLKLERNLIGEKRRVWIPGFTNPVKWDHYCALHEEQEEAGFRSGKKLSKISINYQRCKMKVYPAAHLLSTSVADSLQERLEDGSNPRLSDSAATIYLTRAMDCLFYFLNSRSPNVVGQKAPLTLQNLEKKKAEMMKILSILQGQEIMVAKKDRRTKKLVSTRVKVYNSRKKTVVIGFTTTVHALLDLAHDLLTSPQDAMKKFCTYFENQDGLEHHFSIIRQHAGWNDNPSPLQFKYITRKVIACKCSLSPALNSNCTTFFIDVELTEEDEDEAGRENLEDDAMEMAANLNEVAKKTRQL